MIKRSGLKVLVFFALILLVFPLITAKITITPPLEIYNFGDTIFTTVSVNPSEVSGSFEINLICDGQQANFYKISPAESSFTAGVDQMINHKIILTKEFIGNLSGTCHIETLIGKESVSTNNFVISSDIFLTAKLDKFLYNPGETISLSIDAIKANSKPLNGMAEVSGAKSFSKQVVDGKMVENFAMAETAEAGSYNLDILAYDSDASGILNQKNYTVSFQINQVAKALVLSPSNTQINPGETFEFGLDVLDQSGKNMEGNANAVLISPLNEERTLDVKTGESGSFSFATNDTAGVWRLIATYGTISDEKEITVLEKSKIEMKFLENTTLLIVWNSGNAPYNDKINVNIGNETQTLELNILPGEERRFNLQAPRGTYEVKAESLDGSIGGTMLLTGRAISVTDWDGINLLSRYPIIWAFIVAIFLLAGIIALIKFKKTQFRFKDRIHEDKHEDITVMSAKKHMERQFLDLAKPSIDEANSVIDMKGKKDYSSVVCVHLKNPGRLTPESKAELTKVINEAKSKQGIVDWKGNHVLIIFSPIVTKTFKNEMLASRTAYEIMTSLNEYNKKYTSKIEFNIGINSGDLISSLQGGKLNYTSLGNTIILAKRISDLDSGKMLVSGDFRAKLMRELKVDSYAPLGNTQVFSVNRLADMEANQAKLNDVLKRMGNKG